MKTYSEAVRIFQTAGKPATSIYEAQQAAHDHGQLIIRKYGWLDPEITDDRFTTQIMWSLVLAATQELESGMPPHRALLNLAYSAFRHGLIVGIEMERREIEETESTERSTRMSEPKEPGRKIQYRSKDWTPDNPKDQRGNQPVTDRQIRKLLTMLSLNEIIATHFEHGERIWDEDAAIEWVRTTLGIRVDDLTDLTHKQIGLCFEELGE